MQRVHHNTTLTYRDSWPSFFLGRGGTGGNLHVDMFGSSFWMAVFEGRKHWKFVDEGQRHLLYVYSPHLHARALVGWWLVGLACPRWGSSLVHSESRLGIGFLWLHSRSNRGIIHVLMLTDHTFHVDQCRYENRPTNDFPGVDLFNPDYERFPLLRHVRTFDIILEPGDLLFVPGSSPHQVRNVEGEKCTSSFLLHTFAPVMYLSLSLVFHCTCVFGVPRSWRSKSSRSVRFILKRMSRCCKLLRAL